MSRLTNYIKDTRAEMKHVSWPTQKQAIIFTVLVIGVSITISIFLGIADFIFSKGIDWFIG